MSNYEAKDLVTWFDTIKNIDTVANVISEVARSKPTCSFLLGINFPTKNLTLEDCEPDNTDTIWNKDVAEVMFTANNLSKDEVATRLKLRKTFINQHFKKLVYL